MPDEYIQAYLKNITQPAPYSKNILLLQHCCI